MFGLLKRGEKVFVTVISDCSRESLMPVIRGLILESFTIYTDGWKVYDDLVLNGYEHYRVSLEISLRMPQRERVLAGKETRQRNRELLELRQEAARDVQRSQFRRFCATLEGVRVGGTTTCMRTCSRYSRDCTGRIVLIRGLLFFI